MKKKCRKFSKRFLTMVVSLVMLVTLLPMTIFAKGSEKRSGTSSISITTEEGSVIIPFEKIWIDDADSVLMRPQSITVKLFKYVGTLDISVAPLMTKIVTQQSNGKWETFFDISGEALFDNSGNAYMFAVVEDPVANYAEVLENHVDPSVSFIPPQAGDGWSRILPCNELNIQNDVSEKSIVIAKKGNRYVAWSVDALSSAEREAVYQTAKSIPGMGGAKYSNFIFISGLNGSYSGMTITSDKIIFDKPSDWSFFATGTYKKSSAEANTASITNKAQPITYPVIVNYYKDSVTSPNDTDHFLGTENLGEFEANDTITLNGTQLDVFKPEGYLSGVQQGEIPYVVVKGEGNVINVLYIVEEEEIPDEDPPLTPPEEEIPDEEPPLAPPKTGDAALPLTLAILMALMAAGGYIFRKKAE